MKETSTPSPFPGYFLWTMPPDGWKHFTSFGVAMGRAITMILP
jgi:hypothetical protein